MRGTPPLGGRAKVFIENTWKQSKNIYLTDYNIYCLIWENLVIWLNN